jgi:lactate dehydrogenase-like 2-hydroxyacid dehydrogenase
MRRSASWGQLSDPLTSEAEALLAGRGTWPADLARLAGEADLVAVTCHQDEQSRGLVGGRFLRHCRRGVRIVNVARGEAEPRVLV